MQEIPNPDDGNPPTSSVDNGVAKFSGPEDAAGVMAKTTTEKVSPIYGGLPFKARESKQAKCKVKMSFLVYRRGFLPVNFHCTCDREVICRFCANECHRPFPVLLLILSIYMSSATPRPLPRRHTRSVLYRLVRVLAQAIWFVEKRLFHINQYNRSRITSFGYFNLSLQGFLSSEGHGNVLRMTPEILPFWLQIEGHNNSATLRTVPNSRADISNEAAQNMKTRNKAPSLPLSPSKMYTSKYCSKYS